MMDRVFGSSHPSTNTSRKRRIHINPDRYERLIDDDNIYYTFELREFNKGKKLSEDHKRKIGESNTGKKHTNETKRKISEFLTGRKVSILSVFPE